MKNGFICLAFTLLLAAGTTYATPADGGKLSTRATELTRRMAERTKLSEGQYVKVRQLNLRLLTEMAEARKQFASDAAGLDKTLADVQMRYEWDLASILWPKQLAAYDDIKQNFTATNLR
ncbi:hypothetical protein [Hymenobacter glacieicola]|uniref:Uncharacterized protein n=1 Tax=Hymenobacter glacieicola TaxID=1562124 RepID=A0ABQ1X208_9BACT|nr:hypothetical protein [Hymenobacter glacieicola]GGG51319.1 hypothetical protein GCM10011378_29410 [Hymenobacter glacieicola]